MKTKLIVLSIAAAIVLGAGFYVSNEGGAGDSNGGASTEITSTIDSTGNIISGDDVTGGANSSGGIVNGEGGMTGGGYIADASPRSGGTQPVAAITSNRDTSDSLGTVTTTKQVKAPGQGGSASAETLKPGGIPEP